MNGTIQSPSSKSRTLWDRLSHNNQLSVMLQSYSSLPFNVTAGATTIQGTQARPTVNGAFISRNAGVGFDFLNLNARLSRTIPLNERVHLQILAEAFNLLNHTNGVTLNGVFGTGAYPTGPVATFKQVTAVADSRALQLALRVSF